MAGERYTCSCGAGGDLGELVEHCLGKFRSSEDQGDHVIEGVQEPDSVTAARSTWQRRIELQNKLVIAFDATIEEIRDALLH